MLIEGGAIASHMMNLAETSCAALRVSVVSVQKNAQFDILSDFQASLIFAMF